MVYSWVTSPIDQVTVSFGFEIVLQISMDKTASCMHAVVHSKVTVLKCQESISASSMRDLCVCVLHGQEQLRGNPPGSHDF